MKIFECLPEFGHVLNGADHVDIFVKLDSQYDDYTVAELERFCHKLSEILDVSLGILCLCRVDKGCLQLMFQVPSLSTAEDVSTDKRARESSGSYVRYQAPMWEVPVSGKAVCGTGLLVTYML